MVTPFLNCPVSSLIGIRSVLNSIILPAVPGKNVRVILKRSLFLPFQVRVCVPCQSVHSVGHRVHFPEIGKVMDTHALASQ